MIHRVGSVRPYFPDGLEPTEDGLVAFGGELGCEILEEAYRKGIFPWTGDTPIPWFSLDPRLVLLPEDLHRSRSLRRAIRSGRFEVRFDTDFARTIASCAEVRRKHEHGTWITANMIDAYTELHHRGIAHSIETYATATGELCGGLYGLGLGRAFMGESMFMTRTDASKVALAALCDRLVELDYELIDCQQVSEHMQRLGAIAIPRSEFLDRLGAALQFEDELGPWR